MLRHENALLRRQAGRVRYEPADRAWFAALAPDGDRDTLRVTLTDLDAGRIRRRRVVDGLISEYMRQADPPATRSSPERIVFPSGTRSVIGFAR